MVAAHYDSVPAGPGAADDGASVAILVKVARMLAGEPPPRNDVAFLVTDGEEIAMQGARLFCAEHPWAKEIAVVVNLEARGSSGPSLMFETSRPDAWLASAFARTARRPITGSLFAEVYRRMPHDSDLTVFMRAGMAGVNFAFIGDARNYHTANDDLSRLSRASLQHQGDNALALVRELAAMNLSADRGGEAVYFDVMGLAVVRWPAVLSVPLALLALLAVAAALLRAGRSGNLRRAGARVGAAAGLAAAIVAGALALGCAIDQLLGALDAIPRGRRPWVDRPVPIAAVFWGAALAWAALVVRIAGRRLGAWAWWGGVWATWSLLALAAALLAPGASYLALGPALAAGAAGIVASRSPAAPGSCAAAWWAALAGAAAAAVVWSPMEILFYQALGFGANLLLAARAGLFATTLAPLLVPAQQEHSRPGGSWS
jgi:hypothetical protein